MGSLHSDRFLGVLEGIYEGFYRVSLRVLDG